MLVLAKGGRGADSDTSAANLLILPILWRDTCTACASRTGLQRPVSVPLRRSFTAGCALFESPADVALSSSRAAGTVLAHEREGNDGGCRGDGERGQGDTIGEL